MQGDEIKEETIMALLAKFRPSGRDVPGEISHHLQKRRWFALISYWVFDKLPRNLN